MLSRQAIVASPSAIGPVSEQSMGKNGQLANKQMGRLEPQCIPTVATPVDPLDFLSPLGED